MAFVVKDNGNGGEFEPIPTGVQQAVCAFVEDVGTHAGQFQGRPTMRHQCVVCWELSERMACGNNVGKPFMISKFYTASLNEKATLRKDLEAWRGKAFSEEELDGFDLENLIGVNCMLNIIQKVKPDGKVYCEIGSIMPLIKTLPKLLKYNTEPPAWIEKKRKDSIEWAEQHSDGWDRDAQNSIAANDDSQYPPSRKVPF